MIRFSAYVISIFFAFVAFVASLNAQSSNLQYQVANMAEDQRLMMEQMRALLSEMDELRRENARLKTMVEEFEARSARQSGNYATVAQVNELIRQTATSLQDRDEVVQREMSAMVNRELTKLTKRIEGIINNGGALGGGPVDTGKKHFPTDGIPKTGIPYTVEPGDTLSGIANKLNSRADWIQNINKISSPQLLQVGQTIFVPQKPE